MPAARFRCRDSDAWRGHACGGGTDRALMRAATGAGRRVPYFAIAGSPGADSAFSGTGTGVTYFVNRSM